MRVCRSDGDIQEGFSDIQKKGTAFFATGGVILEKFVERAHHVEVQIIGDGEGNVIDLGERECSVQRRNQKVVEETPSPLMGRYPGLREELIGHAKKLTSAVKYRSAGTVEFVVDGDTVMNSLTVQ